MYQARRKNRGSSGRALGGAAPERDGEPDADEGEGAVDEGEGPAAPEAPLVHEQA